jgi:hypothetical protein
MAEVELGHVTHYFSRIGVAVIQITQDTLRMGDTIHVKGHTSDFTHKVEAMQIDGRAVAEATIGQSVGLRVKDHAREHDQVFKVVE